MADIAFRILGPLEVAGVAARDLLSAIKPRQLLATLLLHPNRFVSTELITDALWEGVPPRSAAANLRTYVGALRDCLDKRGTRSQIETHQAGYRILVSPDDLDSSCAESLTAEGRHLVTSGDGRSGLVQLDRAYRLWRGTPLEDLPLCSAWHASLTRLEQRQAELVEEVIPLHIQFGDPRHAIELARDALRRDPYSEDLWCHVLLCLKESGHLAAARGAARECRALFADELGVEPDARLSALVASLGGGPAAGTDGAPATSHEQAPPSIPPAAPAAARHIPRQLPPDIADFTGRERQLAELIDVVCSRLTGRPPVAVLSGPPGAGKSTLALRAAHAVREHFPDGQLFLDLRAGTQPRDPGDALGEMLLGLGLPDTAVPVEADRRAATLRSELAGRRVLMVLDDAASVAQVAPLVPGTGRSALIVTSRRSLAGLTGAHYVPLDVMTPREARQLLAGIVGGNRIAADDAAARQLVEVCGHLPLAIRVAAGRLALRPDLTMHGLAVRLQRSANVLDELAGPTGGVRASADVSYRMLNEEQARGYRLLGMLSTGDCPAWAFQAFADPLTADRMIDGLVDAHLAQMAYLEGTGRGVLRIHNLLRRHAREQADTAGDARADVRLVVQEWIARTDLASRALPFRFFGVSLPEPQTTSHPEEPISAAWFDAERNGLLPILRTAVEHGFSEDAWRLAASWSPYFNLRGHHPLWAEVHQTVLPAVAAEGHELGRAVLLRDLGQVSLYHDELGRAGEQFTASLALFEKLGHVSGIGVARTGIGTLRRVKGEDDAALAHYRAALDCFMAIDDRAREAVARNAIAFVWLRRGELDEAESWLTTAFDLAVESGDEHRQAQVRRRLAVLRQKQGRLAAAQQELDAALRIFESLQDEHCACYARAALGELCLQGSDLTGAQRLFVEALRAGKALGDITTQAQSYQWLGEVSLRAGREAAARRYFSQAVRSWQLASNPAEAETAQQRLVAVGGVEAE